MVERRKPLGRPGASQDAIWQPPCGCRVYVVSAALAIAGSDGSFGTRVVQTYGVSPDETTARQEFLTQLQQAPFKYVITDLSVMLIDLELVQQAFQEHQTHEPGEAPPRMH